MSIPQIATLELTETKPVSGTYIRIRGIVSGDRMFGGSTKELYASIEAESMSVSDLFVGFTIDSAASFLSGSSTSVPEVKLRQTKGLAQWRIRLRRKHDLSFYSHVHIDVVNVSLHIIREYAHGYIKSKVRLLRKEVTERNTYLEEMQASTAKSNAEALIHIGRCTQILEYCKENPA